MGKNTIRYGLYVAAVVVILTLSGIFGTFASADVIAGILTLDVVTFIVMLAFTGFITGQSAQAAHNVRKTLRSSTVGSLIVGIALAIMVLFETVIPPGDMIFVFRNYEPLIGSTVTFGYEANALAAGLTLLLLSSAGIGLLMGVLVLLPGRVRSLILASLGLTVVFGIMEQQINAIINLTDALALSLTFAAGYILSQRTADTAPRSRLLIGLAPGLIIGFVLSVLGANGAFSEGGLLFTGSARTNILSGIQQPFGIAILAFGLVGAVGGMLTAAARSIHNGGLYFFTTLLLLGVLNQQGGMTVLTSIVVLAGFGLANWFVPPLGQAAEKRYNVAPRPHQRSVNRVSGMAGLLVVLIAPIFVGQYVTNVMDTVMLFIIMGIGLNVMVGFTGLLDLGYVASFAIGAYTSALLTTPSIITTGCVPAEAVQQYGYIEMCLGMVENWGGIGVLTFWQAWPLAVIVSAVTGMALGVPVLGLRGDYLAIVTLGFGEITRVLTRANVTKPLLGAAQGISPIPSPVVDLTFLNPEWYFELNNATSIYYLYVFGVLIAGYVVLRLAGARLGRAWRAIRADEDVAEAMGIHRVRTKLLAFGISSAFAGLGGAIFAAQLRGIFPDSFTILVSINVLSLIIIGGMRSIPGVAVGALVLVGMPEVLRELQNYRLLVFGSLLVTAMLMKPDGLIPPGVPRLSELASRKPRSSGDQPTPAIEGERS